MLIGITTVACVRTKDVFLKDSFVDFEHLKINTAVDFELKNKSEDVTPTHLIGIGEGIYPNKKNYELETPRTFKKDNKPNFQIETSYYYVAANGSVKVILYQWDDLREKNQKSFRRKR